MADGEYSDAVLSDVEEEYNPPVPIVIGNRSLTEDVSIERFRELVAELDRERHAREALEKSKSELQVSFDRLKVLVHEAIKKRDESSRQRDELLRSNEKLSAELAESVKEKDELLKHKDDLAKELEELVKAKDSSRSEIATAAQMLVTGIDKISGKVNHFKNFTAGGLPRSQKYTGLPAVAYGVIKRTNEIVEELVRQIELTTKSRNEAREQMEQRNYEKLSAELAESVKEKDELLKHKDDLAKELEELVKAKDSSRSEIATAAQMLVTGIDKISGKVNHFKNFTAGGLPRSQKYTGLPAVAYGVIKRTNEIVEELVRQIELTTKSRNEAREQMEQRNYEIAIEVSELEATISGLRDEVSKRNSVIEHLEQSNVEKDEMIAELETELNEKQDLVSKYGDKLRILESQMDSQRPLLVNQLSHVSKIHDQICEVIKVIDGNKKSDLSESLFLPQETDLVENIRASLAGLETISELSSTVLEKTKDLVAERSREVKSLNEEVTQLIREKQHIGSLLRSALSRRVSADLSSKTNELFKVAEKGLRESGINYRFTNHTGNEKLVSSKKDGNFELDDDEISTLAGALENIIKQSQIEIIELQHTVDELRAESSLLKEHVETQAKELLQSKQKLGELEEKERVANENVEGLMMDIAAAEEEITRWKVAAQQEAAAGKAVEQDYVAQLQTIRQELEEAKQSVIESEKKLKFKEETAAAAMSARDAAETSLKLADTRAARLRERVEELTSQLEQLDTRKSSINGKRPRYICWPWQWLGLDPIGPHQLETHQHTSNEMELSEPFL